MAVIPTVPGKGLAWLQVRAWDTTLGATYGERVPRGLGGHGESNLFEARGGCPECEPPVVPRNLWSLESFRLLPVISEPSTWALLAFGGAGLWLAARRKTALRRRSPNDKPSRRRQGAAAMKEAALLRPAPAEWDSAKAPVGKPARRSGGCSGTRLEKGIARLEVGLGG